MITIAAGRGISCLEINQTQASNARRNGNLEVHLPELDELTAPVADRAVGSRAHLIAIGTTPAVAGLCDIAHRGNVPTSTADPADLGAPVGTSVTGGDTATRGYGDYPCADGAHD